MLDIKLNSMLQRPKPQNQKVFVRENVIKSGGKAQIYMTADAVLAKNKEQF